MSFLYRLLEWALLGGGQKVLTSLGIFIATSTALLTISDLLITQYTTNANNMPAEVLGLLHLVGFDKAVSYVLSAMATRAAYEALAVRFSKA